MTYICRGSGASPYDVEFYTVATDQINALLDNAKIKRIKGAKITRAKDGNKTYWRIRGGGDFTLVRIPSGYLELSKEYCGRHPSNFSHVAVRKGESFHGTLSCGKNRSLAIYSVTFTDAGLTLTPRDRESWGDRAWDISEEWTSK